MSTSFKFLLACFALTLFVANGAQLSLVPSSRAMTSVVAEAGITPLKAKWGKKVVDTLGNVSCLVGKGKNCWVVYWGSSNLTLSTSGIQFGAAE